MPNIENLKPVKTTAEAKERGRKGGIASGKARRERKTFRDTLETLLSMPIVDAKDIAKLEDAGIPKGEQTQGALLCYELLVRGKKGNTTATKLIADILGERVQKIETEQHMTIEEYFRDHELVP